MAGITLAQLMQVTKDPMKKYIGMQLLRESKLLNILPFENVSGLNVKAYWWKKLPTGAGFRSMNEGYDSYEDGQLGDGNESVYGFGGDVTYDGILEQIKDVIGDPVRMQVDARLQSMAITWNNHFINGDVATEPKGFNGLKKRVAAMDTRQTIWAAGSSAAPMDPTGSAALARRWFNMFNKAIRYTNQGNVSAILMNENMQIGVGIILSYIQGVGNYLAVTKDQYGREEVSYKGIPFVDPGLMQDQTTEIIPETEVAGDGGTDSTSIYFCSFNTKDGVYGIQLNQFKAYDPLNGGEMESKPAKLRRIDWWNGIASFGRHGITRIRNIERLADWTEGV